MTSDSYTARSIPRTAMHHPTLEDAIALALERHRGQTDRAGQPYILHCFRVMLSLKSEPERITGVLHEALEDTDLTEEELRQRGYSEEILAALDALTKRPGESRVDAAIRARANDLARRVKLADNLDNRDISRLDPTRLTHKDLLRLQEYALVHAILSGAPVQEDQPIPSCEMPSP